jgi:hypothetical protein
MQLFLHYVLQLLFLLKAAKRLKNIKLENLTNIK